MADASIVPANSDLKLNTVISIAPSTITQQISNLNTNADKNGGDTLKQNDLTDKGFHLDLSYLEFIKKS